MTPKNARCIRANRNRKIFRQKKLTVPGYQPIHSSPWTSLWPVAAGARTKLPEHRGNRASGGFLLLPWFPDPSVASSPPLALFFTNVRADAAASSSSDRPRSRLPAHFLLSHLSLSSMAATKPPPAAPTDPMARVHTSQRGERRRSIIWRRIVGDSDFLPVNWATRTTSLFWDTTRATLILSITFLIRDSDILRFQIGRRRRKSTLAYNWKCTHYSKL
jgi:hypothetical protein